MAVRDVVQAAAGVGGGAGEYIEDVFSTYLYTGNGSTQTINNGIDLDGEGGLVWTKSRSASSNNALIDTVIGRFENAQSTNLTAPIPSSNGQFTGFLSNGYSLNQTENTAQVFNVSSQNYVSWTFRKAPKFFDVVTYTGNDATQNIAHNLGSVPGCIIVKRTDTTSSYWGVYHRSLTSGYALGLNTTEAAFNAPSFFVDSANQTSTQFTVGTSANVNASGGSYVAYLFAHNAGGFGDDGEQNVISCGSFTTDGSGNATVSLGYEPQWVLEKASTGAADNWNILDVMRGASLTSSAFLRPNTSSAEAVGAYEYDTPTATGFNVRNHSSSTTYIYIAIRRPMKTPESGTEVFAPSAVTIPNSGNPVTVTTNFPVDLSLSQWRSGYGCISADRLRGGTISSGVVLQTFSTSAESTSIYGTAFDSNVGIRNLYNENAISYGNYAWWNFRRAPGFMDVVCYKGTDIAHTEAHSLGVAPEMIIVKKRTGSSSWSVLHNSMNTTGGDYIRLNLTTAKDQNVAIWNSTLPTNAVFTVGASDQVNHIYQGAVYVAYLFASLPGISKVSSYTGTGADLNVDCGFSAGARFILIKRTDSTGDWYVWDSARGIVAGNDPYLLLNSTAAEVTTTDYIDPLSSGFTVTSTAPAALNASGGTYIFLAIA